MWSDKDMYGVTGERDSGECEDCGAMLRWDDSCPRCHPDPPREVTQ